MISLENGFGRMILDERWPRLAGYVSPDGKTRIPGEREALGPRVMLYRKKDRAQLTSDDDDVQVDYALRLSARQAVYHAQVTCDGRKAVEFTVVIRLDQADASIRFENVREFSGYCFLSLRFQRVVAASSRDADGRVLTGHCQGRVLDPSRCKPGLSDYSWHGAIARPCGAAYRSRFMVTFDVPGYEDLFVQEVRQRSRVGFSETLASLGAEMMFRQRTVEDPKTAMPPPPLRGFPPVARLDVPLRCTGPREIRLHFLAARTARALDWTDAARYFQALVPRSRRCHPLYDQTLVYKILQAERYAPRMSVEQSLAMIRKLYHLTDGLKQVCYWTGFQHFGHDSGWPDIFTVYPAIGDKAGICKAIREARAQYRTELSFHLNFDVFSDSSPQLDGRYLTRDSLGRVSGQGNWGGNLLYGLCIPEYRRPLAALIGRIIRTYGIRATVHLDTYSGGPYGYDASPDHPYSAYDLQQAKLDFLKEFNRRGLDVTSECLTDPYVGHIGHIWALFNYGTIWEGEERVPFANYVYHGATSWNAGHGVIPIAYFADKPGIVDTILGMLVQGGGVGLEIPGHDKDLAGMIDLLYLVQPPYHLLRNRKWTGYRQTGSVRRVDYGRGSFIEVDPAKPGYRVVVDGRLIAKDFQTISPGPRRGTYLAYSRVDGELDWPAPGGWKDGPVAAVALTDSGPGVRGEGVVENKRLQIKLQAHVPMRLWQ